MYITTKGNHVILMSDAGFEIHVERTVQSMRMYVDEQLKLNEKNFNILEQKQKELNRLTIETRERERLWKRALEAMSSVGAT